MTRHRAVPNVSPTALDPSRPMDSASLMLAADVAELLQVSTAWVYAETRRGRLPHIRLGRYVRYRRAAIEAWLDASEFAARG